MNLNKWRPGLASQRQRLTDPYYRFQTPAEVQLAAELGVRIDVNKASVDDWLRLPGLSIHQARSLVDLTQNGLQFYALEDLAAALGLSVQRLQPLTPILQFCYYGASQTLINPNTAAVEHLLQIPGVDAALAHAIVRDRVTAGPYRHLADLQQRLALSPPSVAKLLHYLRF